MPLISDSIPNLISGISQQPAASRKKSQAEAQVNCVASIVRGNRKRPGSKHIAKISNSTFGNVFAKTIKRDSNNKFKIIISNGDLKVFDISGVEQTVTFPNGKSYLTNSSPRNGFAITTIADFNFIVNKSKTVAIDSSSVTSEKYEAIYFVKQGRTETDYKIYVNGTAVATESTNASDTPNTETIATNLETELNSNLTGYTITRIGSVIVISHPTTDFTFRGEDSYGNLASLGVKGSVEKFSDLPEVATNGFTIEVSGTDSTAFDNYYVQFESDSSSQGTGKWVETIKPGLETSLDNLTMPHRLERKSDGTWEFNYVDWSDRQVGDNTSAPFPSFVGLTLNDIFLYKNRLGLLSDENVIYSEAGEYFNFFPTTVSTVLDSSRIDTTVSENEVSILEHALPFNENLLLFSDEVQFIQSSEQLLTQKTIEINSTTKFEISTKAKPIAIGENAYFVVEKKRYSDIREYYVNENNDTNDAAKITAHVPNYCPKNVFKLAGSSSVDYLLALSSDEPNKVYVYQFYWNGSEKLQSAWHHWEFDEGDTILNVDFIDSQAYIIVERQDGVYLESIILETGNKEDDLDFHIHLDRKVKLTGSYDIATNTTTWNLPYEDSGEFQVVRDGSWSNGQGMSITTLHPTTSTLTALGDYSSNEVYIGRKYESTYELSTLYVREQASNGAETVISEGRLQIRNITFTYEGAGYFNVEVTPKYRDTKVYKFRGRKIGSGNNVIGKVAIEAGEIKIPIKCQNTYAKIKIVNDSYLPHSILSAEWIGLFSPKSKRI